MSAIAPTDPGHDGTERLSADDMATRREGEFLQAALQAQQAGAARAAALAGATGRCANCGERCAVLARYCDDECRSDHERRLQVLQRQGRAGARGA